MKSIALMQELHFTETHVVSEALLADQHQRILRFALLPQQIIPEHSSPDSAIALIVLSGTGIFTGADQQEVTLSAHDLIVYEPGEVHAIRALDQELVFVLLLKGAAQSHEPVGLMV